MRAECRKQVKGARSEASQPVSAKRQARHLPLAEVEPYPAHMPRREARASHECGKRAHRDLVWIDQTVDVHRHARRHRSPDALARIARDELTLIGSENILSGPDALDVHPPARGPAPVEQRLLRPGRGGETAERLTQRRAIEPGLRKGKGKREDRIILHERSIARRGA